MSYLKKEEFDGKKRKPNRRKKVKKKIKKSKTKKSKYINV